MLQNVIHNHYGYRLRPIQLTEIAMHTLIYKQGSQYFYKQFPFLGLPDEERSVKYFSLNPFLPDSRNRCPLECAYCICHEDKEWHHHPEDFAGEQSETLLELALSHILATNEGQAGYPISLCDYSDPFIEVHQQRVLTIIERLGERQATNMLYITTKYHPGKNYLIRLATLLAKYPSLRPTIFVSLPPLKAGYEAVSIDRRVQLIKELTALNLPCCWYLRPITPDWYDEALMWHLARELLPVVSDHVILSGVVMTESIAEQLQERQLAVPEWNKAQPGVKQQLSPEFENHLRNILSQVANEQRRELGPVMSHRLCGTNGNHGYGCMLCGKSDRYCQLFQLYHYDHVIENAKKPSIIPTVQIKDWEEKP